MEQLCTHTWICWGVARGGAPWTSPTRERQIVGDHVTVSRSAIPNPTSERMRSRMTDWTDQRAPQPSKQFDADRDDIKYSAENTATTSSWKLSK